MVIGRLFDQGVVLRMGTRELRANSTQSLRSELSGHAAVSATRMTELGNFADSELAAHAAGLAALTASLSSTLSRHDCNPAQVLVQIYNAKIPVAEVWTNAIAQVSEWPSAQSAYQRALLDTFVRYLASERDCIRTLIDNRKRAPRGESCAGSGDSETVLHQRLIFDVGQDDESNTEPVEFNRLTKGKPLDIPMSDGQCVQIMLAHYRFALICGSPWRLVDEYGEDLRLPAGRCVTGRSTESELIVHDSFRAISRRHVVLETQASGLLRVTDISSLGTFVPRAYLDKRLH
jgi:hypothetical protein